MKRENSPRYRTGVTVRRCTNDALNTRCEVGPLALTKSFDDTHLSHSQTNTGNAMAGKKKEDGKKREGKDGGGTGKVSGRTETRKPFVDGDGRVVARQRR